MKQKAIWTDPHRDMTELNGLLASGATVASMCAAHCSTGESRTHEGSVLVILDTTNVATTTTTKTRKATAE